MPARPRTRMHRPTGVGETIFPNGLKLLTRERREVPIVTVMLWYRVGSRNEVDGMTGIAHFLEHLMFKGTDRYQKGEIDRLTQLLGGTNNAMTGRDFTSYYFSLPTGKWEEVLAIEANRMRRCRFETREVELERNVVLEEIRRNDDSPFGLLEKHVHAAAFTYHPYRHPILGWRQDLERLPVRAVREFYRSHYHPANAFLVMAGDFETREAVSRVASCFGGLAPEKRISTLIREEPEPPGAREVRVKMDVQVPKIQMGFRTISGLDPDDAVLDVISSLLSDGRSSLLVDRLVEGKRLLSEVETTNDTKVDAGIFWVYGTVSPGVEPERAGREILRVIQSLARRGPPSKLLEQSKNQAEADYHYFCERIFNHAYLIGKTEIMGGFRRLARYLDDVRAVSAQDVRRVAGAYLVADRMTVGYLVGNGGSGSGSGNGNGEGSP